VANPCSNDPIEPMDLANMRANGVHSLDVQCNQCRHRVINHVDHLPGDLTVPSFGPRMVCTKCGTIGADVRPNWSVDSESFAAAVACRGLTDRGGPMGEAKRKRTSNVVVAPRIEVMLLTDDKTGPDRYEALLVNPCLLKSLAAVDAGAVHAVASPPADGTVGGSGTFAEGSPTTVTATANSGHSFIHWTENGKVVSTFPIYTFTMPGANVALVADFQ
jgi:hypothetical protein